MKDRRTLTLEPETVHSAGRHRWLLLFMASLFGLWALLATGQSMRAQEQLPVVVHKMASTDIATIGETAIYSITIQNLAADALVLHMDDPLPLDVGLAARSLQASTGAAAFLDAERTVQWDGTLKPEETADYPFRSHPDRLA